MHNWSETDLAAILSRNEQLPPLNPAAVALAATPGAVTKRKRSHGGKRADLDNQNYRSAMEANYARYLNWLLAQGELMAWEYEPRTFYFPDQKRGATSYTPDFLLHWPDVTCDGQATTREEWIETKGWLDAKSRGKLRKLAKYFPEIEIRLLRAADLAAIASKVAALCPGWEWPATANPGAL